MVNVVKKGLDFYEKNFAPKLWEIIKRQGYSFSRFKQDTSAGLTVAVISIPLSMALAIASGVTPAQGLYTAIVAGFFIALFAGGRYQIGGPTGAFAVLIFTVLQNYGYQGLLMSMLITGSALIIAGLLKLGTYIKYIPYPVVLGFTGGIGLLLITTQFKDLLGLQIDNVPVEVFPRWNAYLHNLDKLSVASTLIALVSFGIILYLQHRRPKMPTYLISVLASIVLVFILKIFGVEVDTIGNRFGGIPHFLPAPQLPEFSFDLFVKVLPSGLTIAFLAAIESLLCATVADGMSGDNHNPNTELIGEGAANLICSLFAGIPATSAIARTATNFKSGAYSPVSGLMNAVFIFLFMLILSPIAQYIPLACLSAVLTIVGWNMLGLDKMIKIIQGPKGDRFTLIVTLLLTLVADLNTAISVGFILSSIIFMHRMSREMEIATDETVLTEQGGGRDLSNILTRDGVMSLRLSGPLFFGAASQVSNYLKTLPAAPKVLILRMGYVPVVDATGAHIIVEFLKKLQHEDTKIIFSNVKKQPRRVLHEAFLREGISGHNISTASTFENAIKMTKRYLREMRENKDAEFPTEQSINNKSEN